MIQVTFRREKCIGCDSCSDVSPGRWKIDSQDGKGILIGSISRRNNIFILNTTNDELEDCLNVSENCPVSIIEVKVY